ncbi:ATP-binding protein [Nocardioides sp.]|uniref:ATP-binding protein n=1 Tax=Nocardioides sp. TaxID=35761 RepID=UPI003D125949
MSEPPNAQEPRQPLHARLRQNPYGPRPGESPPYLAGRTSQIKEWARPVRRLIDSGRVGAPIFFTAPRGLGKTVLLRELQTHATDAGFVTAWVTANAVESLVGALLASVRSAIANTMRSEAAGLLARLDMIKLTAGLPGVLQLEASTRSSDKIEVSFTAELAALARALADKGATGLMLFVDELQSAPSEDLEAIVPALQEWTAAHNAAPLMFIGSGPIQLSRVLAARGGFAERFQYVTLERLSDLDSMSAFTLGLPAGFQWLPGAVDAAVGAAEGHPYMIQLIGHYAWEVSDSSMIARPFFSTGDIGVAVERAGGEIRRVFEGRWADTPDAERRVLAVVSAADQAGLSRRQVADEAGMPFREAESAVDRLYANGWLDVDGLERVRIGLPGVAEFVNRRQQ